MRQSALKKLEDQVRLKELQIKNDLLDSVSKQVSETAVSPYPNIVNPLEPFYDTPDFWFPIGNTAVPWNIDHQGKGEYLPVYISWYMLKWWRDTSRVLVGKNPFALNAIENRVSYVVGKGFKYCIAPRKNKLIDDSLLRMAQDILDEFIDVQDWPNKEQEIVFRSDRDGEAFIRLFDVGNGRTEVRFVEPEYVREEDYTSGTSYGIITDADDINHVLGYMIATDPGEDNWTLEEVDAENIVHFKLNVDSAAKRGLPTLFPVRENLQRAVKLQKNMARMVEVQATFAIIRKHQGASSAAVSAFQQTNADFQYQNALTGNTHYQQQLAPGSIVDASANTEYQFPGMSPTSGFVSIFQAELRTIAARLCMPEYMVSADASNGNYSSSMIAESPAVKNFERLQAFFGRLFGSGVYLKNGVNGVMWRVLRNAVDAGRLPNEVLTDCEIIATAPSTVVRDKLQEAQKNQILHENGVLSTKAWAEVSELDFVQQSAPHVDTKELLMLQQAYHKGELSILSAKANARASWGLSDAMLDALFPPAPPEDFEDAAEGEESGLKGMVGGLTGIKDYQAAVYAGSMPREAAIATVIYLFKASRAEAEGLFPDIKPEKTSPTTDVQNEIPSGEA